VDLSEDGHLVVNAMVEFIYTGKYSLPAFDPTKITTEPYATKKMTMDNQEFSDEREKITKDHVDIYLCAEK
jgi:hypothetical protein